MDYKTDTLKNNLNIVTISSLCTKIVSVGIFIKAGSRNETNENNGIAHFLEHMMFKGTLVRSATDIFEELDRTGASYNAATSAEYTYYYATALGENVMKILDILIDIYLNAVFNKNEIKKEKNIVLEELKIVNDSPGNRLNSKMNQIVFDGTSLARSIGGTAKNIKKYTESELVEFRNSLYKPDNTVIVISGKFNRQNVVSFISNKFDDVLNNNTVPKTYYNEKSIILSHMREQNKMNIYVENDSSVQQCYIIIEFPLYDIYDSKKIEIELLTKLLSGGFSSRLLTSLRENNGIVYNSMSNCVNYSDVGIFLIKLTVDPSNIKKALSIVFECLNNIKKNLITEDELVRIKNILKTETLISLNDPELVMEYFGQNMLINRNFSPNIKKINKKIDNITKQQIMDVANYIFIKDKTNIFISGPINNLELDIYF